MTKTARTDLSLRIVCCALIAILQGSAALAQPTNTVRVEQLDGPCNSTAPNSITVWLTIGNETRHFTAVRGDASKPWIGAWGAGTFPANRAMASLRLQGRRTGCQWSTAETDASGNTVAVFRFECDSAIAWRLDVSTEGEIVADYERTLSSDPACVEKGSFRAGNDARPIEDIRSTGEELRLRFASTEPRLLVFSSSKDAKPLFLKGGEMPPRPVWNPTFKATRTATGQIELKRAGIVAAVVEQALDGRQLSPNSRDLFDKNLKNAGMERLFLNAGAE